MSEKQREEQASANAANVEQALNSGIREMHGYRSSEAVEIMAKIKPRIKLFLSYASADKALKEKFFGMIKAGLKSSKEYEFVFASDKDLLCGENWHEELQRRIDECDGGILLVSTNFFASAYILEEEVPKLMPKCFPVALKPIDMVWQDMRGLEKLQFYFMDRAKSFEEVRGANQSRFILEFAQKIEERIKDRFSLKEEHPGRCRKPGDLDYSVPRFLDSGLRW